MAKLLIDDLLISLPSLIKFINISNPYLHKKAPHQNDAGL